MLIKLNYDEAKEAIRNYIRDVKKEEIPEDAIVEFDGCEITIGTPIMCEPIPLLEVIGEAVDIFKEIQGNSYDR